MVPATACCPASPDNPTHASFLTLQPVIEQHARIVFRHFCAADREEAIAEAVACAFESYLRLKARGKDPEQFPSQLAHYAVLHVKDGRHVGGRCSVRDVLSFKTQKRRGFQVEPLPDLGEEWLDRVRGDTQTPV